MNHPLNKVVIPVAGLGTRGLPATKVVAKELLPIVDTPTVHFIVEEAISAGIDQVVLVTSRGKSALEDYFDASPYLEQFLRERGKGALADRMHEVGTRCEVLSVRQKEPLGLGHAIRCARPIVGDSPFAVCLGDQIFPPWEPGAKSVPALKSMVEWAKNDTLSLVGVVKVAIEQSPSYGMIDAGGVEVGETPVLVKRAVEKPAPENAPSPYAIVGRYIFYPEIFDLLERTKPGVGGEIQLTDAMNALAAQGKLYASLIEPNGYDVGNHLSYVKAQIDSALSRPELAEGLKQYMKSVVNK